MGEAGGKPFANYCVVDGPCGKHPLYTFNQNTISETSQHMAPAMHPPIRRAGQDKILERLHLIMAHERHARYVAEHWYACLRSAHIIAGVGVTPSRMSEIEMRQAVDSPCACNLSFAGSDGVRGAPPSAR